MKLDREAWLTEACALILDQELMPIAEKMGLERPPFRVSVGWPKGSRAGRKAIAQCWSRKQSDDGVNEIFVTPECDDIPEIMHTLQHELIHAILDNADGHRGRFRSIALASGLTGQMTSTTASEALAVRLAELADVLGEFPHATLNDALRKRQGTRMKKLQCGACGFTARTTQKWLDRLESQATCPVCEAKALAAV